MRKQVFCGWSWQEFSDSTHASEDVGRLTNASFVISVIIVNQKSHPSGLNLNMKLESHKFSFNLEIFHFENQEFYFRLFRFSKRKFGNIDPLNSVMQSSSSRRPAVDWSSNNDKYSLISSASKWYSIPFCEIFQASTLKITKYQTPTEPCGLDLQRRAFSLAFIDFDGLVAIKVKVEPVYGNVIVVKYWRKIWEV